MKCHLALSIVCLLLLTTQSIAQETPLLCDYADQNFSVHQVFVRMEWDKQRLVLVSWNNGEDLLQLEENFSIASFEPIAWSGSCRYFLAAVEEAGAHTVYAWDTRTGQRIGTLLGSARSYRINWSSDEHYLLIQLQEGGFLWNLTRNQQMLLNNQVDSYGRSFYSVEWDLDRNELLLIQVGSGNGLTAYDLNSGNQLGYFHIGDRPAPVDYLRFGDKLLVFTTRRENFEDTLPRGLAIWDRTSHASIQLDPNFERFNVDGFGGFDIVGNLSSGYFIIADYGVHFGNLYVWNLDNLQGNSPYVPSYQQRLAQGGEMRLLDNKLEIADWYVWAYVYTPHSIRVSQIDLQSNSLEYQSEFHGFDNVCPNPHEELVWACEQANTDSVQYESNLGENNADYWPPRN